MRLRGPNLISWRTDKGDFDPAEIEPTLDYLNEFVQRIVSAEPR